MERPVPIGKSCGSRGGFLKVFGLVGGWEKSENGRRALHAWGARGEVELVSVGASVSCGK